MATVATPSAGELAHHPSESPLALTIDRWIYVFMAAFFTTVVLIGFVPDSVERTAAVMAGERHAYPLVLHFHAALMGSFLLLLLAQTTLAVTGRMAYHQQLGLASVVIVPALVIAGFILVPTTYHELLRFAQTAPADVQAELPARLARGYNIMLTQIRIGIAFPLFVLIGLLARKRDAGLHKRMMVLAVAPALPAAFGRMEWLPTSAPDSPLSSQLYILFAVSPLLVWDLVRERTLNKAWLIWFGVMVPSSILIFSLWNTEWWHSIAPTLVGVEYP